VLVRIAEKIRRFVSSKDGSIKTRVIRSGIWVSIGEMVVTALSFVKSVILARLLAPEMFGLIGLCNIVIRAIETFTRPGISQALIQRRSSFTEASNTAFTLLVARGFMLAALLALVAPGAALFYESSELDQMLKLLALVFVIGGFTNINTIAKQKELDFRSLSYLSQSTAFLGLITTVGLAYWLRNAWALVFGQIATTFFQATLSYYFVEGRPRIAFSRKIAKELLSYGKFITASSAVLFVSTAMDTATIGKILDTQQLGYYVLAFTIANLVTASLSKVASGIMMPAYSKLQNDNAALRSAYLKTSAVVMFVCFPATIGLIITSESVIHVIYGPKWSNAALPLQILAVFGMLRALSSINGFLFEGIGKPQIPLYVGLVRLAVILALIIPLTIAYGLEGAATAVTVAMALQLGLFWYSVGRILDVRASQFLDSLWGPIWKSSIMGIVVYVMSNYVNGMTKFGLAVIVISGMSTYLILNVREIATIRHRSV
jgi:O-antigen/teichoic acid export membrane protein